MGWSTTKPIKWAVSWQTNITICVPGEDSCQPGHPPSLIRVFAVCCMGSWGPNVSSCGQRRLWPAWADAQADLSLRWAHSHFVGFVMRRLIKLHASSKDSGQSALWISTWLADSDRNRKLRLCPTDYRKVDLNIQDKWPVYFCF